MNLKNSPADAQPVVQQTPSANPEIINNQSTRKFRPEIQGLRALAVLLVAAYHLWFGRVSGGVDVFLLISAFLMAGSFTRKLEQDRFGGFKAVYTYWVHVFKRILPLASVTVVGVLIGSYLVLPASRWSSIISEAKSVVLYYENWWSIANMVDYYATDSSAASPLRHFWSLSVQGQIYILWPLVFFFSWLVIRRTRVNTRALMALVFGVIFAVSLAYSVYITAADQQTAYFNTFARVWEFALGSLVAIVMPWLSLNRYVRAVMGWVGLAMLVSCGFIFDVNGVFPGYLALWPTMAAAMIIVAGDTQTRFGPEKLLMWKPLVGLGNYSYGLYLVHWPLLVFFLYRNHAEKAGIVSGVGLLTLSLVASLVLTRCVEAPLRSWRVLNRSVGRALGVVGVCVVLVLGSASGWQWKLESDAVAAERLAAVNNPGARVLEAGFVYEGEDNAEILPTGEKRTGDWPESGPGCTNVLTATKFTSVVAKDCQYPVHNPTASKKVIVVGYSHMKIWSAPIVEIAKKENWDLQVITRGWCPYGDPAFADQSSAARNESGNCNIVDREWNDYIKEQSPDLVIMPATFMDFDGSDKYTDAIKTRIQELTSEGIDVVGIRGTPRFPQSHRACMESGKSAEECTFKLEKFNSTNPLDQLEDEISGFGTIDLTDQICPNRSCPPIIGNVYTYFDGMHLTATYARSMGDTFDERLEAALERAER